MLTYAGAKEVQDALDVGAAGESAPSLDPQGPSTKRRAKALRNSRLMGLLHSPTGYRRIAAVTGAQRH